MIEMLLLFAFQISSRLIGCSDAARTHRYNQVNDSKKENDENFKLYKSFPPDLDKLESLGAKNLKSRKQASRGRLQ